MDSTQSFKSNQYEPSSRLLATEDLLNFEFDIDDALTVATIGISEERLSTGTLEDRKGAIKIMTDHRFDVLPIRQGNAFTHFWKTKEWMEYSDVERVRMESSEMIPYNTPLHIFLRLLACEGRKFYFLEKNHQIVGLATEDDLNSRPFMTWLFVLISELEASALRLIRRHVDYSHDAVSVHASKQEKRILAGVQKVNPEAELIDFVGLKTLLNLLAEWHQEIVPSAEFQRIVRLRNDIAHNHAMINRQRDVRQLWSLVCVIRQSLRDLRLALAT